MMKTIKLSELVNMIAEEININMPMLYIHNRNNPLCVDLMRLEEGKLNEGYYKTYPIENVLKYIKSMFGKNIIGDSIRQKGNSYLIILRILKSADSSILDRAMSLCGYHIEFDGRDEKNKKDYEDKPYVDIQYAPRYSDKIDDVIQNQEFLFHVCPANFKERIMKIGLIPSSKNSEYKYPGRVYLFKGKDANNHRISINKLAHNISILYNPMKDIDNEKDTRYDDNRHTWSIFQIDTSKLPQDIEFYDDTTWGDDSAIWTYSNIPPSSITHFRDIEI